ncbi:MAG TPA: hypothetical protein VE988_04315 [Gemmataceae bacterium]|nr:hypothetical protein [Gemmataceae bacterium]
MKAYGRKRAGLTLMELVVVIAILVAMAGIVVPLLSSSTRDAGSTTTVASMQGLKNAILAYSLDMKGVPVAFGSQSNTTGVPQSLKDLLVQPAGYQGANVAYDPVTRRGWRGPYLSSMGGKFNYNAALGRVVDASFNDTFNASPNGRQENDPTPLDGWGFPIVLQWPETAATLEVRSGQVRLVSGGVPTLANAYGDKVSVLDDIVKTAADPASLARPTLHKNLVVFVFVADPFAPDVFAQGGTP